MPSLKHSRRKAKKLVIIGSTGSVGTQTLQVAAKYPALFKIEGLACHKNTHLLYQQIKKFQPSFVAIHDKKQAELFAQTLQKIPFPLRPQLLSGSKGWEKIATLPSAQKIIFASSGITALASLCKAIKKHKEIALANKEILVVAGDLVMKLARDHNVTIVPIDSEHSAIFQCLQGENYADIEKIILTCSGGPFFGRKAHQLKNITRKQALDHPTWKMGSKISIDSATLLNKGFEVIEAMHLFGLKQEQVQVVIHPESIVHSLVQFKDGSIKAQLSTADMRLPILYALSYPARLKTKWPTLDFSKLRSLHFYAPDKNTFQGLALAKKAIQKGHPHSAIMTLANDQAVQKFLQAELPFHYIYRYIKQQLLHPNADIRAMVKKMDVLTAKLYKTTKIKKSNNN